MQMLTQGSVFSYTSIKVVYILTSMTISVNFVCCNQKKGGKEELVPFKSLLVKLPCLLTRQLYFELFIQLEKALYFVKVI